MLSKIAAWFDDWKKIIEAQASRNNGRMTDVERRYCDEMGRQIEEADKEIDYLQGALRNQQ